MELENLQKLMKKEGTFKRMLSSFWNAHSNPFDLPSFSNAAEKEALYDVFGKQKN